jgi:predicted transcriptional regulator of viral defense system
VNGDAGRSTRCDPQSLAALDLRLQFVVRSVGTYKQMSTKRNTNNTARTVKSNGQPGSKRNRVVGILKSKGLARPHEFARHGITRSVLQRMSERGEIERVRRGLYALPGAMTSEHQSLIEANKRVPSGVICLLSALSFHRIGTQLPHQVWMAIDRKTRRPRVEYPPLRIVRFSGQALTYGIEEHLIDGVVVRVTSPARTIADCFKYRNKIGLDIALEALRESWRERRVTMDELFKAARVCRVERVIRPYAEALV